MVLFLTICFFWYVLAAMTALTKAICWELVATSKDKLNGVGAAIYRKPTSNECYEKRSQKEPPICQNSDDPNAAWYLFLQNIGLFLLSVH